MSAHLVVMVGLLPQDVRCLCQLLHGIQGEGLRFKRLQNGAGTEGACMHGTSGSKRQVKEPQ